MAPTSLIVVLILTAIAYRRGWHGWALLPLCIPSFVGLGLFLTMEIAGKSDHFQDVAAKPCFAYLTWAPLVALVIMIIKKRD
jgi:hypothetical protein